MYQDMAPIMLQIMEVENSDTATFWNQSSIQVMVDS